MDVNNDINSFNDKERFELLKNKLKDIKNYILDVNNDINSFNDKERFELLKNKLKDNVKGNIYNKIEAIYI
ncbi:hypothetical protein B1U22_05850 (plasmid) [Borreliella burgdorferi]|uniref:hypothetical protein n=1 Tax=Borreliella burgdorferi TaxID=139 RepID=UPI00016B33E7|nr:hypothetical protein [Borreliella burgdorferi]ARS32117.1 hypothetical protein B1U22_05850 [Borreliella burgdorferi]ARS32577.1 hypothetical protein B1U21_01605 [Borreliella burgdorferi]MCR8876415.1 hypothetical protein [Borreliella burgdorferi]UUX88090.1 hypothetical protein MTX39_06170 [Borreliella burgdorferi]